MLEGDRWELYKVLADPQRLRLIAAAATEELTIGELAELFEESQPNVSRQLGPLRRLGLVAERKQGTRVFIRFAGIHGADPVVGDALAVGRALCERDRVLARIPELMRRREAPARAFFGKHAGSGDTLAFPAELPAYLSALGALIPCRDLAVDLGTGDGRLLEVLAPIFHRVIGVDRETVQLEQAARRLEGRGYRNVTLVAADIADAADLSRVAEAGPADVVFAARVLHHAPRPQAMISHIASLLAPGGTLLVIDYVSHHDEGMREAQADLWLGFSAHDMVRYAADAGLVEAGVANVPSPYCTGGPDAHLDWHILSARRPERGSGPGRGAEQRR